jgi:hypothetical protein
MVERSATHDRSPRRGGNRALKLMPALPATPPATLATLLIALLLAALPVPMRRALASGAASAPDALGALSATIKPAATHPGCLPLHDGYLRARLRGASDLDIRWDDAQLQCDGGLRPTGGGILVTFVGRTRQGHHRVRFVFGIDAAAKPGLTRERAANVTVIFEGEQRLYSTRGDDRCTVDRLQQIPATQQAGSRSMRILRVQARGFCIAPATALDGHGELLLSRFDFAGLIRLGG